MKGRIAAYVAGSLMAGLGGGMAMAALALSFDDLLLYAAGRFDLGLLAQAWAGLHAVWGSVVGAVLAVAGRFVGGAEGAKAVSMWLSVAAVSPFAWKGFKWSRKAFGIWVMSRNGD